LMGTKRPFDEGLQEFIKHPRHIDNGNKPDYFGEDKHSYETSQYGKIAGEENYEFYNESTAIVSILSILFCVDVYQKVSKHS
ncbi:hypothetical protein Tco_0981366, partial [Tanacetum coccineum]